MLLFRWRAFREAGGARLYRPVATGPMAADLRPSGSWPAIHIGFRHRCFVNLGARAAPLSRVSIDINAMQRRA